MGAPIRLPRASLFSARYPDPAIDVLQCDTNQEGLTYVKVLECYCQGCLRSSRVFRLVYVTVDTKSDLGPRVQFG